MGSAVKIIQDDSLRAVEDGYEIEVRLNWYRSLPVSSVEALSLSLDGETVQAEQMLKEGS